MIRKIKLYIVLVAVLLSASSCLDKYPQDAIPQEEAIKTVSDVRQALVGIYAQWFFVKFGGNLFFISMVFLFFFLNPIKSCRYVCFLVTLKTPHH